jgi:hypothetical protein
LNLAGVLRCWQLDSVVSSWEGEEENDARMLERLLLLKDVASGLQVLHSNNVVHGDLVGVESCSNHCVTTGMRACVCSQSVC